MPWDSRVWTGSCRRFWGADLWWDGHAGRLFNGCVGPIQKRVPTLQWRAQNYPESCLSLWGEQGRCVPPGSPCPQLPSPALNSSQSFHLKPLWFPSKTCLYCAAGDPLLHFDSKRVNFRSASWTPCMFYWKGKRKENGYLEVERCLVLLWKPRVFF